MTSHTSQAWHQSLPELAEIEQLRPLMRRFGRETIEGEVSYGLYKFPIYSFRLGSDDPLAPCIAFIGGVHGLERIGTNVLISYMKTICALAGWDDALQSLLSRARLLFYPLVNPVEMFLHRRSNGRGIDLMRNAPIDADAKPNIPLVCGHRISNALPWYRGEEGAPMEIEAQLLQQFVRRELESAPFVLSLDVHSGFGLQDRLWFPYANSRRPFEHAAEVFALKGALDETYPHHVYCIEPQSKQYVTHGDLWDYFYLEHRKENPDGVFLPLCLEMGSWLWVKKNPRQLFSLIGIFNPILPHRMKRTLRRHVPLMDFLLRATVAYDRLLDVPKARQQALDVWYAQGLRRGS